MIRGLLSAVLVNLSFFPPCGRSVYLSLWLYLDLGPDLFMLQPLWFRVKGQLTDRGLYLLRFLYFPLLSHFFFSGKSIRIRIIRYGISTSTGHGICTALAYDSTETA